MSKPAVLIFVKHYLPGNKAGGPLRSISNLVERLGDEFEFRIVTLDRDYGDSEPYPDICPGCWTTVGKAFVMYLPQQEACIGRFRRLMDATRHDIIYLNSFFDVRFTLLPELGARLAGRQRKPIIIAPRGEFSLGAISLKSWKKRPFLLVIRLLGIFRKVCWQASSEHEAADIRREFGVEAWIKIASNCPGTPLLSDSGNRVVERVDESLRIIFLSRLSPKKNLDFAIRVLSRVRAKVAFSIVGPESDAKYYSRCVALARGLPSNISVEWIGSVDHNEVTNLLAQHDLLFFPTRGENYGHVIAESLSAGTPVLLADTTPWRELESHGVGWDFPLADTNLFVDAIEEAASKTRLEQLDWRRSVLDFAKSRIGSREALQSNRRLFNDLLLGRSDIT